MVGIVAELRKSQKRARKNFPNGLSLIPVREDHLAALLDIAEAVAEEEPWNDRRYCRYCGRAEWDDEALHSLDCAYRRAREMCGEGDD